MILTEMIALFMDSRKRGTTGARKRCSPATLKIYTDNLRVFENFLQSEVPGGGVTKYESIRRMHIVQFCDWLDARIEAGELAKASVYQVLRTIRTLFLWVDKDEDCQIQELKGYQRWLPAIPKNPRRLDIPPSVDLKKFKNSFNTDNRWGYRDYVITCLLLTNGMRLGELCNLTVDNILWAEKLLYVSGKQGARAVPVTGEMLRLLKGWLKRREGCEKAKDSPHVFISKRSAKLDVNAVGQRFRKHCKKYGLPRITAHTFRHSFCTDYLKQGGDIAKLKDITGHTTLEQLMAYTHLARLGGKSAQEELERVNRLREV